MKIILIYWLFNQKIETIFRYIEKSYTNQPTNQTKMSVLLFNLTTGGSPFLHKAIPAKDIKTDMVKSLQELVGGRIEPIDVVRMKVIIHPMFKENKKWRIAEKLMLCKKAKVYVNENGMYECCGNMGVIVCDNSFRVGGCPHLWGEVAVSISQSEYEKICDEPLDYWKDEYGNESDDEDEESDCDSEESENSRIDREKWDKILDEDEDEETE